MELKHLIFAPFVLYFLYCAYCTINHWVNPPEYKDCGIIIAKSSDEVPMKHGVTTELYLIVNFKQTGKKAVLTEPVSYFTNKVGDNVCFTLNKDLSFIERLNIALGIVTVIAFVFAIILTIMYYGLENL